MSKVLPVFYQNESGKMTTRSYLFSLTQKVPIATGNLFDISLNVLAVEVASSQEKFFNNVISDPEIVDSGGARPRQKGMVLSTSPM